MKIIIFIGLFFMVGCTTSNTTLENLMRTSYYIGCGEAMLAGSKTHVEVKEVLKHCEEKATAFKLEQTGIYQENMEVYMKTTNSRKNN